jgi:hypothetical protein
MALRNVAVLLGAVGSAGCTGESSFALPLWDAGAPDSRYEGPCSAWAKTECAYEDGCPSSIGGRWADDAQCLQRETLQCELEAADPDVRFDPVAVATCVYPTDCTSPTPGLCLPAGRAGDRAACQWNEACAGGLCLFSFVYDAATVCGACFAPPSCSVPCDAGAACERGVDGGDRCVMLPPAMPVASLGQSCGSDAGDPPCFDPDVELFCDDTEHCRAYQPASYGQQCGQTDSGATYLCEAYGSCASIGTLICEAPAADGALCDDQQGLSCLPPARCQMNHCAFPNLSWCTD